MWQQLAANHSEAINQLDQQIEDAHIASLILMDVDVSKLRVSLLNELLYRAKALKSYDGMEVNDFDFFDPYQEDIDYKDYTFALFHASLI